MGSFQEGESRKRDVGLKFIVWLSFSEKYSRGHGGFKVFIDKVYGALIIEGHDLGYNFFERRFGATLCMDRIMFLLRMSYLLIKEVGSSQEMAHIS